MNQFHSGTASAVACSAVSCAVGFNLHEALGVAGQCIGIVSGVLSIAWVAYQFWQSRKH
jgi:hypothetical protein